jgi:putative N6-adenine-specific DNA methylase
MTNNEMQDIIVQREGDEMHRLIATAAFGLETVVKDEVRRLGFADIAARDGKIEFSPAEDQSLAEAVARANLWLRSADRVLIKMGEFEALTFDGLFESVKALPWGDWIEVDGQFTVTAKSVRSGLFSVSDIQSIVKKAVVEKLRTKYHVEWFKETGAEYTIQAALLKDICTITIDTTGAKNGLHKRGYRERSNEAPMKETMAAALVQLARYKATNAERKAFLDPCCGSGTIAIEAAMIAKNIAPGLGRKFAAEKWTCLPAEAWKSARSAAYSAMLTDAQPKIYASDISREAIELARENAELAGVDDCIEFSCTGVRELILPTTSGICVVNPPYGERLGAIQAAEILYKDLGRLFARARWNVYVITPDEFFETAYGRRAKAKRKLFNGMIKVDLFQYF